MMSGISRKCSVEDKILSNGKRDDQEKKQIVSVIGSL